MQNHFESLWSERRTDSGRACVRIAAALMAASDNIETITEARAWVKLSLEADRDDLTRKVAELERKFGRKSTQQEKRKALKAAAGKDDNVVALRGDAI